MTQSPDPATARSRRMRIFLAVVLVLAGVFGIGVLALEVARQIDAQSGASTDNVQWALSQIDVELLGFETALGDAVQTPSNLDEVRKRFDIFYSRVQTLSEGEVFAQPREDAEFKACLDRLQALVQRLTPSMDLPDASLQPLLAGLRADTRAHAADAHTIALKGVQLFAAEADLQRAAVKWTLLKLGSMTVLLIAALGAILARVLRLEAINRAKAEEVAQSLSRLDAVVATALDAVITLNDYGQIIEFNPAAELTFGHSRAEALGKALSLVIPLDAQGRSQLPPRHQRLSAGQRRRRVTARHRDGHDFPAEVSLSSAQSGDGMVHVVFLRDLSQQVAAEEALVTARDKALAGEKAKADLLVVMSHEIRTPLNGLIGTIELLEGTPLVPHQREYLRIMAASGRLLMHHVNDVLDIARLDSGKAGMALAPVDLGDLAREVIENQTPAGLINGNRLEFIPAPDGRHLVLADAARLRQVLMNLVGNAVKFTQNGAIRVEVLHRGPRGPTEILVRDTGPGIAREDLSRIFEDFVTLDPSYARKAAGTGLGLGIVRRIVTRMGGRITVDSEVGRGSTFRVTLPLTILEGAKPLPEAEAAPGDTGSLKVLVVEDNDFNRIIVRDMLRGEGHRVTEAPDGPEGVRQAEAQRFDVILMDISMPGIDGVQAAGLIRQGQGASRATPIIALTAHALQEETDRFRANGMSRVLVKPITRDSLRAALADLPATDEEMRQEAGLPLLDPETLVELRATLGQGRADDLVTRFLNDTDQRIGQLLAAPGPDVDLIATVHRISGAAAMFGAARLHAKLSAMESLCKGGECAAARLELGSLLALWQDTARAYRDTGSLAQASSLR